MVIAYLISRINWIIDHGILGLLTILLIKKGMTKMDISLTSYYNPD